MTTYSIQLQKYLLCNFCMHLQISYKYIEILLIHIYLYNISILSDNTVITQITQCFRELNCPSNKILHLSVTKTNGGLNFEYHFPANKIEE